MTTFKQRLEDLMREKKVRTAAHNVGLINQTPNSKMGTGPKKEPGHEWLKFRDLSDEMLEKKLNGLPEDEMLELYKKLEREVGLRIDPENYKRHKIVKNFMILWTRKKEDERRKAARGEVLVPMSADEIDQVMSDRGRGTKAVLISKLKDVERF